MDLVYIALAGVFWLAIFGMARGCAGLQGQGGRS